MPVYSESKLRSSKKKKKKRAIKNTFYDFINRKHLLTGVKDLLLKLKSPCFFIGARQYHINVKNHGIWKTLKNTKARLSSVDCYC